MGILRTFAENHAHPGGFVGMLAAWHMIHDNRDANYWTVGLLDIKPTDHVLEIGFGPGLAIQKVVAIVKRTCGWGGLFGNHAQTCPKA